MTRATQTASFISKHLLDVPIKSCSMIEEGAPIEPEPSISGWKPELRVCYFVILRFQTIAILLNYMYMN